MYEKWLKAFHMVATEGGFTRAARALNVGQPTVSTHIKSLEDHFRVELFYRRGRKFELSEPGKSLLAITQGLYGHEAEAASYLRMVGRNERGLLRLGAVGPYEVIELAHRFRGQYPLIEIAVNVAGRDEIVSRLANFEIDVGILADDIGSPEFHSALYDRNRVLVMAPATHRLARRTSIRIEELQDEPVIFRDPSSATRRAFEGASGRRRRIAEDHRLVLQFLDPDRSPAREPVRRRRHDQHPIAVVQSRMKFGAADVVGEDPDVDLEVGEAGDDFVAPGDIDRDLDQRILAAEAMGELDDLVRPDRAQAQKAAFVAPDHAEIARRLGLVAVEALGDGEQRLARLGQFEFPPAAIKQLDPEVVFERFDVGRNRRLADVEGARRAGEPALGRDHVKRFQPLFVHRLNQ